jgi:hypothetical protein
MVESEIHLLMFDSSMDKLEEDSKFIYASIFVLYSLWNKMYFL